MSDLRPKGMVFKNGEKKLRFLFSIFVIDEIQSSMNKPIFEAIGDLTRAARGEFNEEIFVTYCGILRALILNAGEKPEISGMVTPQNYVELAGNLLKLFSDCMPEPSDFEDDEEPEEDHEPELSVNVARILYLGCKILNYTEQEVFAMTMRKFQLLYDEYLYSIGKKKREDIDTDDMFRD